MSDLKIPPQDAARLLNERLDSITELGKTSCELGYYDLLRWCSDTWGIIDRIYGSGGFHSEEIRQIGVPPCSCSKCGGVPMQMEIYYAHLQKYIGEIEAGMQAPE
jgi:hypothetical protein